MQSEIVVVSVGLAALVLLMVMRVDTANAVDVNKWSVYETTLTASKSYTNPYTEASVTAAFTGPGSITKTVKGFWDGGSAFKIRFAPTVEGAWNYTTSSSDAGLNNKSGSFTCIAPLANNHGFIRRDKNNPYNFVWDDGTRFFLFGQTYYGLLQNAMAGNNWKAAIDGSSSYGINKVRMYFNANWMDATPYTKVSIYGSGGTDKNQLNLPAWQKWDEIINYLASKGMVADLIFYRCSGGDGSQFGTQVQDERYVRYIIARLAAYNNVIWCLANEWNYGPKPQSYWDGVGTIVRNEDPWINEGSFSRLLSTHQGTHHGFDFFGSSWPVHVIIQDGLRNRNPKFLNGDEWGNYGIVYNLGHDMPVVNDEYGYVLESEPGINWIRQEHRRAIWGVYTAGGYGSAGDRYIYPDGGQPVRNANWRDAEEYQDIKNLVNFFTAKSIEYWKMSSGNSLVTSGTRVYVLAETRKQYVIYAAIGGTFSVNIDSGKYKAYRYNPSDGTETALADVVGGGIKSFNMPDSNDWVLYITNNIFLSDDFESYSAGDILGQGGWAISEDSGEAPNKAKVVSPGLTGSQKALYFSSAKEGAGKSFTRSVGSETIIVEFDFLPGPTNGRALTLGLRSGTVEDAVKGFASAYIKADTGKFYHLTTNPKPNKWVEFSGLSWSVNTQFHARMFVDYTVNSTELEINGVLSPTKVSNWWTFQKPGCIDLSNQFGVSGSKLDNLSVKGSSR